jgi:Uma2 family endonuclease
MVLSAPRQSTSTVGEQRLAFHHLDWQAYQQIRQALEERSVARLTYDRGSLEIVMPLEIHEFSSRMIGLFIRILVVELGLKIKTLGSTTLDREDLDRGAQPDNGYYIQNYAAVAGRDIDFSQDPPPDLVVEVDISHSDLDKNQLYAAMGVREFWRFNGRELLIYGLEEDGQYQELEMSPTFPLIEKADLYRFLAAAKQDEVEAEIGFRAWVRERQ